MTAGQMITDAGISGLNSDRVAKEVRRLIGSGQVNVFDFMTDSQIEYVTSRGSTGDGTGHVAAIQDAIDYAYNNKIGTIRCPSGNYRIDGTVYLDPPGNIRAGGIPTLYGWSMALVGGDETIAPASAVSGTFFRCTDNDFVALQVGPGNGNHVKNIHVSYDVVYYPWRASDIPTGGYAFAVSGGSAGASFTLFEGCFAGGFYVGFYLGNIDGALADSTTLIKCQVGACIQGVAIGSSQAYLNSLYDCRFSAKYGTYSSQFPTFHVFGGSYMNTGTYGFWRFPMASVSALSDFTDNTPYGIGATNHQFTATLTTDTYITGKDWADRLDFLYDRWALKLPSYGLVPITLKAWNSSTKVATFALHVPWLNWFFQKPYGYTGSSISDISDEIQDATGIYASDHNVLFYGGAHVKGTHIETGATITVMKASGTNDYRFQMQDVYFNGDPTQSGTAVAYTPSDNEYAQYAVQGAWALFEMSGSSGIIIDGCSFAQTQSYMKSPIIVDVNTYSISDTFQMYNADLTTGIVLRTDYGYSLGVANLASSPRVGMGRFDRPYITPSWVRNASVAGGNTDRAFVGQTDYLGFRPDPALSPKLLPSQVDAMLTTVANFTTVPVIEGSTIYSISDSSDTAATGYIAAKQRGLIGSTWGKDITVSGDWSYKGCTSVVLIPDDTAMLLMFAGLCITLNDGSNDWDYIVTGVNRQLGYIYVFGLGTTNSLTQGTKGVTYSGGTIKQKAYNVKKFGRQCEFGTAAPSTGTWAVGDICYNTAPSSSGYVGWVCTVAGTPGTWKGFGVIA